MAEKKEKRELGGSGKPAPGVLAFVPRWVGTPPWFFFKLFFCSWAMGPEDPGLCGLAPHKPEY